MRHFLFVLILLWPMQLCAQSPEPVPGMIITMRNWQQYRDYMSDGVQALFEGKYAWKMPADVEIDVGHAYRSTAQELYDGHREILWAGRHPRVA
jgi:hypothetical protein